ncbi:hypothetical protein M4578_02460 [Salipiger sp. P9]|uniref:hypothetical protein n=1 Tax=Salipiger pentaromativorans TaxID=2943193 RepID=UPI00215758DD|nr:hypothetical protein [Salipiger pentaromativorans]MCR8546677.1 hypothetical protein [Salipiger pentaromativorans]
MKNVFLCGVAALALSACSPSVPDSGTGVGFEDYRTYSQRQLDAQRQASSQMTVQPPTAVESRTLDDADTRAAATAAAQNSGVAPVEASPSNPAPQVVTNAAGISNENNFEAVSAERDIQADAALIAQNRAQYQLITPTDLPPRPDSDAPNIVEYALRTTNPVGVTLYKRSGRYDGNRISRACGAYNSSDLAQEAFLSMGGPDRDRKGLDPDGDGFACAWDPAPFRAARGG